MSVDAFLACWGFVAFSVPASQPEYVRATFAERGQSLSNGHHCQDRTAADALRGLDAYLRAKGMQPRAVA